ncbi:S8 family serine peptidase, partial [Dehalococcoidia bacterium]|nr:S8 family serine peptidase [Dehalococcoidia bacterium]
MKKANYGLSLLMVLALVLMGLAPVFASPQAAAATGGEREVFAATGEEREVFIEIEGVDGAALGGLSTNAVVSTLRAHASETQQPIIEFLEEHGAVVHNTFWLNNLILATVNGDVILELFNEFPQVERVFPNFTVTIPDLPEPLTERLSGKVGASEDPPPPTWGVERIRAPEVWAEGIDGTDVRIAVLDTGVHIAHPDLEGRMWTDDPDNPEYPGGWIEFNAWGHPVPGSVPHDTHGHGTHCSGTALGGATGPAAIGVAPGAWLMHALILPGGSGTCAQVIAGMQWAIAPHDDEGNPAGEPADVVSMSFGAPGFHYCMIEPIENMIAAGIVPVAAIGNAGEGASVSPGNVFESFGIGATAETDTVPAWSSGQVVDWPDSHPDPYIVPDFAAPGVAVLSAVPPDGYAYWSGTSMAAPHVAGTVALMLQHRPDLTTDEIYELLRFTACDLGDPAQDVRFGWGIIDAFDATFLDSGIVGVVTDAETGAPLAGAAVYVHDVGTVFTDDAGNYVAWLWPGEYTLTASIFGYGEETATVTVEEGEFAEQDFALTLLPTGFIAGTVTAAGTGEPIAGAVITVLETPLAAVTDAEGGYTIEGVPIGTYDVHAAAEGYFPAIAPDVVVEEDATTVVDFALELALVVAVIGDWAGQLEELLDARGHLAEPRGWDVVADMADYDVVVVNRLYDPGEAVFLDFLAEAEEHGVGLLFTSSWPWVWPWGIRLLQLHLGDPTTQRHNFGDGPVFYEVTMSHPIFAGWGVGEEVTIIHGGDNDHAWFEGYSGITAADVGSAALGVRGGGMAFTLLEENAHLLLASLGPGPWTNVPHWTDDGRTIFIRGVEWVADPPRLALDPPKGGEGHEVVASGVNFEPGTTGTITADLEGLIEPTGFTVKENGEFAVPLTILMSAPPGETLDALFLATVGEVVQATAPFTVLPPPAITLNPDYGGPGTEVTVEGEGFPVETVGIVFAIEPGGDMLYFPEGVKDPALLPASVITPKPFVTDEYGRIPEDVVVTILEDAPQGVATFVVNVVGFEATAPFTVPFDPILTLTPTSGYGGTKVTITGEWFEAHLLGYIYAEDVINPVPFQTDEDGNFEVQATILPDAPLGVATFAAIAAETVLATAPFEVTEAPPFDFSLAVYPTEATITQGEGVTAAVTATLEAGIAEEVTLTYTLPEGVEGITVTFEPSSGEPTFESTMTIAAAPDATVGVHAITITGTAGELVREVTFTLTVEEAPPFDFSLAVEPTAATITQGEGVTATVTATLEAGFAEEVALTAELPADVAGITVTFDPAAGEPTFESQMTIAATAVATVGEHAITIIGTSAGGVVETATFTLTVEALPFDIGLAVEPPEAVASQGDTLTATVTVTLEAGIPEEVTLVAYPHEGITATLEPAVGTPPFTSTLTITVADDQALGTYGTPIWAFVDGEVVEEITHYVTVTDFDFSLTVLPPEDTITQGGVTMAIVSVVLGGGTPEEVTLTAGLPEGVEGIDIVFAPPSDEPTFGSVMSIAATDTATLGDHAITITGTSAAGLVRTIAYTLTVEPLPFDFSLAVEPTAATITQGEEVTATVTVTLEAGGIPPDILNIEEVLLTAEIPEGVAGITVTFEPAAGEPTFESAMSIATATDATVGVHEITITGTSATGGLERTATFTLTVEQAPFDFSLAVEPTAATVTQGEEVTATVAATHLAGPVEEVTLTYSLPEGVEGITVTFDPAAGEPTFESTTTIATAADATLGEHEITITGTSAGELVREVTFTLTVQPLPFDFSLAVEPTAATVSQGEGATATVTATLVAGITEEVTLTAELPEGVEGITVTFDPAAGE